MWCLSPISTQEETEVHQDFGNWQLPDVPKPCVGLVKLQKSENIKLRYMHDKRRQLNCLSMARHSCVCIETDKHAA